MSCVGRVLAVGGITIVGVFALVSLKEGYSVTKKMTPQPTEEKWNAVWSKNTGKAMFNNSLGLVLGAAEGGKEAAQELMKEHPEWFQWSQKSEQDASDNVVPNNNAPRYLDR